MSLNWPADTTRNIPISLGRRSSVLLFLGLYVLIYSLVTYGGMLDGKPLLWWSDMAWTLISLAAGLKCLQTAKRQHNFNSKRAWTALGGAAMLWFVGMLIWDYLELVREVVTPYPSWADYFFLALAPAFVIGIFYYRAGRPSRYVTLAQIGNMGIIVCTVIIVTSVILYPQIEASDDPRVYVYFAIAYVVVMMSAFLFTLFSYWFYRWSRNRGVLLILLAAIFLHACADTLYVFELMGRSYGASHYLNVVWIVAFALQFWAAVEQDILDDRYTGEEAEPDKETQHFEGITPSLSIIAIIGTLWAFGENVDRNFILFLVLVSVVLALFLVMQEWSMSRSLAIARTELEEKVRQRTLELTRANQELEAYSYSIAHDLRAPLRSITGFSQTLQEDAQDRLTTDEKSALARIANSGMFMAQLIDEILELSRVGRLEMRYSAVDMSEMSRHILQNLCETEPARIIEWTVQDGLVVHGDKRLLSLVLQNLLGNAVKYTAGRESARIDVGVRRQDGKDVFHVSDNGAGFDMQYANKLFRPFHRLHREDEFPGSGVGLAIVLRIIERHHGRIWAESAPDKGATFYFHF